MLAADQLMTTLFLLELSICNCVLCVAGQKDMPDQYPSSTQAGPPAVHKVEGAQHAGQQCGRVQQVTQAAEESQQSH